MSDPRPDAPPPRVEVRLPDGRTLPGRLLAWRQGPDGRWWAQAVIQIPADAIGKVAGEDYSRVPREPVQPAGPRYVMEVDERRPNGGSTIHDADCWTLDEPADWARLTPLDADQARGQLAFDGTTACTVCNPTP
jgi:hypothetical protein